MTPERTARAAEIRRAIQELDQEAQGAYSVFVARMKDLPEICAAAMDGYENAAVLLTHLGRILEGIAKAPVPPGCLLCGHAIVQETFATGLMILPYGVTSPTVGLVQAICRDCDDTHPNVESVRQAIIEFWRATFLPEVRLINPHHTPGNA